MKNDHQIGIMIDNAKQLIVEQFIDNDNMCMKFLAFDSRNEGDRCTDSDVLVEEIWTSIWAKITPRMLLT